ncbi:MAG: TSUP family transporter [Promethearchaeota archaeon]
MELIISIIILAFLFEMVDSTAGMGFGTSLAPILFLFGYKPLQVVPVLLISETITGFIDSFFAHEFKNVHFSFHPFNDSTKITLIIAFFGCFGIFLSIIISYYGIQFPIYFIKLYVAILVLIMGTLNLMKVRLMKIKQCRSQLKMVIAFSVLAGFNKGIGGGGYGPVVTLGQLFSGVYEKSATAIASFAEAVTSLVGFFTFILISISGVEIDLMLLPSIFAGGFIAALFAPYLVRIFPNKIWRYVIPIYASSVGIILLFNLF